MTFNLDPYLSAARSVVIYASGLVTAFGVVSIGGVDIDTVKSGFDHLFNGVKEIGVGVGILAPAVMGLWGVLSARLSAKVAKVQTASPGELANAMAKVSPAELAAATVTVPDVKVVVGPAAPRELQVAAADPSQPKITK